MSKGNLVIETDSKPMDLDTFFKEQARKKRLDKRIKKMNRKTEKYFAKCGKLGITSVLDYDSLPDEQPLQFAFIDKPDALGRKYGLENAIPRIQQLVGDGLIGLMSEDSCHYEICCRDKDYKKVCNALNIKPERQTKISYYSDLFTSLIITASEDEIEPKCCHSLESVRMKYEARVHNTLRYILANLHRYQNHFINARGYEEESWLRLLYLQASKDKKEKTS